MTTYARLLWLSLAAIAIIISLCLTTACCTAGRSVWSLGATYGTGPVQSEERPITGTVRSVVAANAVQLRILRGEHSAVQVQAPADILPRLTTRIEGETLHVELLSGSYTGEMLVTITTPGLHHLALSGASSAQVEALGPARVRPGIWGQHDPPGPGRGTA